MIRIPRIVVIFCIGLSLIWTVQACQVTPAQHVNNEVTKHSEHDMDRLAMWIVGKWDNVAQVEREIVDGVSLEKRRHRYAMQYTEIETRHVEGRTFAIENYDDGTGFSGTMQRVSLHRFMFSDDRQNILHEILFLKDKEFRKNLVGNLRLLESITEDDIRAREDCRLYWKWTGSRFEGATRPGACVTNSYTDRDITVEGFGALEADRFIRHDRNFEMSGEEIPRPGYKEKDVFIRVSD